MGRVLMTGQAKGADVFEIALASAFGHRQDVVRVPQALAMDGFHSPVAEHNFSGGAAGAVEPAERLHSVDSAECAAAAVAREDLLAEVPGIGAQAPGVDTIIGTERAPAAGNFHGTPAT